MSGYGSGKLLLQGGTESSLTYANDINANIEQLMASLPAELQGYFNQGLSYLSDANFNVDSGKLEPFRAGGEAAMNQALALQGIGPNAMNAAQVAEYFNNTPGAQFQQEQGRRQVEASAAKKGLLGSGSLLKGLTAYSQGIAAQQFGQRQTELANLAQLGLQAGTAQANLGQAGKLASANLLGNQAQLAANSQVQLEQARTSALQGAQNTRLLKTEQGHIMSMLENAAGR